jgi:hypothetical protein
MSLSSVKIGEEVWLTCLSHALTTETEEVMGLLLGDIEVRRTPPDPFSFPISGMLGWVFWFSPLTGSWLWLVLLAYL